MLVKLDRRGFIAGLGGSAAVAMMDQEARADALQEYLERAIGIGRECVRRPDD